METNEALKQILLQVAENSIETLLSQVQKGKAGDVSVLEQQIVTQVFEMGRGWLEQLLRQPGQQERAVARREGKCGHRQRLVGNRPRQMVTLLGPITIQRAYYQCLLREKEEKESVDTPCRHGEAPFDDCWGVGSQHSSPGVQKAVSYLSAHLTHAGTAEALSRLLPLHLSPRQVGNIIQPIGEVLEAQEEQEGQALLVRGATKRSSEAEWQEERREPIERLSIEMDGVLARLRRGSVPMEQAEDERTGDVYREVKVGAVFVGEPGRERSALVPGVRVDTPGPIQYTARRTTAEAFAPQLSALCSGSPRRVATCQTGGHSDRWSQMDLGHRRRAVSRCGANCG